ncbi:MAG: hypothetical protein UX38_C0007G0023 [Microgenomates group bacterium GW2011_GWC1_46_16]|uniref:Glyoxalase n=2 Tax=Candidatus Collieribacteriota TaxID=1752725 RepID=A0A1F5FXW5_9BACT|nr:MAG: hypothetical protein UX32_C0008G0024 [Microgenomates group bacterium GW2011_GWF1_46_12]KKU26286.1 MAG: hypothetical protein UX38_C0007G0023 [Microgenomates group bacterium GW2011_GWC1_46_16]KKU27654.1 MAG: hypothetical protein UX40_C0009G0024 [Microgenomates group bacterium GW2011_GWF2_46_18]KKU45374.1 MAG: hypothetical protein UX63_C0007G0024 [Microgenomates group bacterium GW2011_GWB1_46_7]KKU61063.1 MAG: hypothetical protein UX82_C0005G0025 [Microgenomates group bacterium GW2011_GWE1
MKPKISIVHLGVKDFAVSFKFYRDGLGFTPHNYKVGEDYIMFEMDGSWLGIFLRDKLAEDARVNPVGNGFSGFTLSHNAKSREDVDKVWEQAVQAGAKPTKKPELTNWGGYSGYFADPDGYLWEVAYNPLTDLT